MQLPAALLLGVPAGRRGNDGRARLLADFFVDIPLKSLRLHLSLAWTQIYVNPDSRSGKCARTAVYLLPEASLNCLTWTRACVCKVCKVCACVFVSSRSKDALHMENFSRALAGRGHNPSLLLLVSFTSVTFQGSSGSRGIHRYFECLFIYGMWHVLNSWEILYFIILGNCWSEATCSSSITLVIALKSTESSSLNFNSTLKLNPGLVVWTSDRISSKVWRKLWNTMIVNPFIWRKKKI